MVCLHVCLVPTHGDQKRALDPLKPELQIVVSHQVDVGRTASALNHRDILPAFFFFFFKEKITAIYFGLAPDTLC